MNGENLADTRGGQSSQRLEGSRFVIRQLCNVAASGSRKRLSVMLSRIASVLEVTGTCKNDRAAQLRNVPGSRLLPNYKAAELQSGSPPGGGRRDAVFLTSTRTRTN